MYTKQEGCFDIRSMLINLLVYTVVLLVTSGIFPGFYVASVMAAVRAAMLMSILNVVLKPILVLVTLPLTIITFGLFYVCVNGIILWLTAWFMGSQLVITSFLTAIFASIFISLLRMGINRYILKNGTWKEV